MDIHSDDKLTFVIGSCPIYHPKKICLFGDPGCTSGTGGWAILRGLFEVMLALHWQSPDEGHFNIRVLASAFLLKQELC
jgi:hypothetical protein